MIATRHDKQDNINRSELQKVENILLIMPRSDHAYPVKKSKEILNNFFYLYERHVVIVNANLIVHRPN